MSLRNTQVRYGSVAKWLHWLIAIGIIGMLILGFYMVGVTDPTVRITLIGLHKSLGLTLLILMVLRLVWRCVNPQPRWPETLHRFEIKAATAAHHLLYLLIFIILLSGWIMSGAGGHPTSFWGLINATLPIGGHPKVERVGEWIHEAVAWVLACLVAVHALAALKHHFLQKDGILKRMLPERKEKG